MKPIQFTERETKLLTFVLDKHKNQKRKYTGEPYAIHPISVASIVAQYDVDECHVPAALCHDLLEDTSCTLKDLQKELVCCGYNDYEMKRISIAVVECTDVYTKQLYPNMNRAQRKEKEIERISFCGYVARNIKYADFVDNIQSISKHDPSFAKLYIEEKIKLLNVMRNGNINLLIECCHALFEAKKIITDK